ncbi:MAG: hypothetical protein PHH85_13055 [Candidatus Methanoperedens sp.]|nr:hypothetical protein [Candidatus Methanoperedens sp.]
MAVRAGSADNFKLGDVSVDIQHFLLNKPSLSQIIEAVEEEAQRIAREKRKAEASEGLKNN